MTFSDDSALIFSKTKSAAIKRNKISIDYGSSHTFVSTESCRDAVRGANADHIAFSHLTITV
jgi:hypothetical protein